MPELEFFEVPEAMKDRCCAECGKPNCDVLVQEYTFGGANAVFHESCLDKIMETEEGDNE